jgi:hypothetical protein
LLDRKRKTARSGRLAAIDTGGHMKRIALLAAAVLGTGCVSTVETTTVSGDNVTVYWTFAHFDYTGT